MHGGEASLQRQQPLLLHLLLCEVVLVVVVTVALFVPVVMVVDVPVLSLPVVGDLQNGKRLETQW